VLEAMYWQAEWVVDHRAETGAATAIRALRAIDGLLEGSSDAARRATVKFRLANFLAWGTGDLPEAEETCREAVRLYEAAGVQRQALLAHREIGWIRYLRGDIAGMTEESAQVVAAAEASGDRFVAMQGLVAFGYSNILRVRFADAESAIRQAVEIAEQDAKAYRLTMAVSLLAAAVALQGRSAESAALFEQARSANPGCDRGSTHISEDQLIVEPVYLAGRAVLPGERAARIYLTNLYNPVLPLIRYEITDEVTVLPGPCPCGSAHRRIADVQGRLDDVFTYQDRRVHPHLFRTELGREAGIVEYQVRQTPAGAAVAVRCSAPVSLDGLRDRVAAGLAGVGLERPEVTVEIVDRFERPGGPAKLKRFVPLEAAPAPLSAGQ
jgi:tetratricopeptide (TPR) repeat protein